MFNNYAALALVAVPALVAPAMAAEPTVAESVVIAKLTALQGVCEILTSDDVTAEQAAAGINQITKILEDKVNAAEKQVKEEAIEEAWEEASKDEEVQALVEQFTSLMKELEDGDCPEELAEAIGSFADAL